MRRLRASVIALIPILLALAFGFLLESGFLSNPSWQGEYQIDAAGLISRIGILASGLILFVLLSFWWAEQRVENTFQVEKKLQADTRLRFLRRLDHELKNPLTIIKVGVYNLQQSLNLTGNQQNSLKRIGQQANRLQKLIQDLRWLSELEDHQIEHNPVDLAEVLTEAVVLMQNTHQDRQLDLNIQQVPWPLAAVSGDRDMLVLVFCNLLDNALKYSSSGDRVEVRANDDGQWAIVEVADTGIGISDEDLPKILRNCIAVAMSRT